MNVKRRLKGWQFGSIAIIVIVIALLVPSQAIALPVAGSQGTDTTLRATDSQVTFSGRGLFANLAITVNQTRNLANQAVSITWTGGTPTVSGPGRFGSHYLQIMQCWGDDDGSVPGNPGPPAEQCEQGAIGGTYGGLPGSLYPAGFSLSRVISRSDWENFDPAVGKLDTRTTNVWLPFRAVDGTVVDIQTDPTFNPAVVGGNFWQNPYYNLITTNEIGAAATGVDGRGAELFQTLTGVQSSGLGCGQKTQPVTDGVKRVPQCWIVVVPRGTPADENVGTPFQTAPEQYGVVTSAVSPQAWQHRIAIPIDFNPVDSPCAIGADQRRISGSELALSAVVSWQPSLCGSGVLPPFAYAPVSDSAARQQLVSGQSGAPGMVVVSQPLPETSIKPEDPVIYAPLTLSGLVIGFNIERNPRSDAPPAAQRLEGVRVADLNLTPRLVAKLLTQSYRQAVTIQQPPNYEWMKANPGHMGLDPDFSQFNPEFELLQIADGRTFASLQLPAGNSDAAQQVWQWVFADPEARAWLNGEPDQWGMKVNPVYATNAAANSTGIAFGETLPNSFPKADPYCYQAPPRGPNNSIVPPPLCGTDWMPYKRSYAEIAQVVRTASDGARISENPFAQAASDVWKREDPQYLGRRDILGFTDTPTATQYGLQMARLSRAGDVGAGREFVAPTSAALTTGVSAMVAPEGTNVLTPDPTTSTPGAYPLTAVTYAAITPLSLDAAARSDYAAFIEFAAGSGQVPGLERGQLPRGYAPLPAGMKAEAEFVAFLVRNLVIVEDEPAAPSTTVASTVAPTTVASAPAQPTTSAPSVVISEGSSVDQTSVTPTTVRRNTNSGTSAASGLPPTTQPTTQPTTAVAAPAVVCDPTASTVPATPVTEPAVDCETAASAEPTISTEAEPVDVADEPSSSGPSVITPITNLARNRFAVPALGIVALGSALGALEVSKRPRRRGAGGPGTSADLGEIGPD